jgi:hypothetical protein
MSRAVRACARAAAVRRSSAVPRGRIALASAVALLVVAGIVGGLVISQRSAAGRTIAWARVPGLQTGPAPWNSGSATLAERLPLAGLHALTMEGAVIHIHQHLDVFVNGRKVPVPALIGIDPVDNFLTEIHTHDASGIIHVESPTQRTFTLGQLFCEWGVKLTSTCLGRYRGTITWWVNGRKMSGDPAQLVLAAHQEIVVAAGNPPSHVAAGYAFPYGL